MTARILILLAAALIVPACASDGNEVEIEVTETNVDVPPGGPPPLECSEDQHSYHLSGTFGCSELSDQYSILICSDAAVCESALAEIQAYVEACEFDDPRFFLDIDC